MGRLCTPCQPVGGCPNVRTISPTKVNEARFGYNSLFNNITQQLASVKDVDAELGVPVKVRIRIPGAYPTSACPEPDGFGNSTSSPFQIDDKVYQWVDNFSWVIGKHSLRMGGEFRYDQFPQLGNEFPRGQFFFDGRFTNTSRRPARRPPRSPAATRARTSSWAIRGTPSLPCRWFRPIFTNHEGAVTSTTPGGCTRT